MRDALETMTLRQLAEEQPFPLVERYAVQQGRTHGLLTIVVVLIGAISIVAAASWSAPRVNKAFEEQRGV